jgi:molybdopterin-guanine dinucleotide biosynthesis protein A
MPFSRRSRFKLSASAIILAGGQSRRMGAPKAALKFEDGTILERTIAQLRDCFGDIVIMAAPAKSEIAPIEHLLRGAPDSIRVLRDRRPFEGAAVALARGLAAAVHDTSFACSCDLPLLRLEVACALCTMLDDYDAVIPDIGGQPQPLCAVYRRSAGALIKRQLASGERRLTQIAAALRAHRPGEPELRQFDPDLRSFLNVNTREAYERALAIKQALGPE